MAFVLFIAFVVACGMGGYFKIRWDYAESRIEKLKQRNQDLFNRNAYLSQIVAEENMRRKTVNAVKADIERVANRLRRRES